MPSRFSGMLIVAVVTGVCCQACSSSSSKKYSHDLVRTYAEVLVFHEKYKMVRMLPDSLYRDSLNAFLAGRKTTREEFEMKIRDLSRDDEAWRSFLGETAAAVDSIKSVRPL